MAARQIVLDTETTGLNARLGDRVIEIGCVEVLSRRITERTFHRYVNPEREIEEGASRIHGLTREDLADKPRFTEIAREFVDYIRGGELVIHNAAFDMEFLDQELALANMGKVLDHAASVVDTLAIARELHPGKKNSLDALCERYAVDNSNRTLHGALLDARLLAEVYLAMTRGQESLAMELETPAAVAIAAARVDVSKLVVLRATREEIEAHEKYLDGMEKETTAGALWRKLTG
ncbi:MAG TPA: DNA polymerase III subunit epsilon [Burkholderiales bacterium]|jgi:DNA polymerase-3 subunit epsilon|nr:DNA polymerase III subunit epsilon [Burkholderiales bacterium]